VTDKEREAMNRTMKLITVSALIALVAIGTGCILEDTGVEIVIKDTYCMTFNENHESATFVTPDTLNLAEKLDEALADNSLNREDLVRGAMIVATYEVTDPPAHDWTITGEITVERMDIVDGPETVIDYASQSLMGAYGAPVFADLNQNGVNLINDAIDDYIAGGVSGSPVLLFKVRNSACSPTPSSVDPLVFEWEACVLYYAVVAETLTVPDPFPGSE
jgi:hypothetical protein